MKTFRHKARISLAVPVFCGLLLVAPLPAQETAGNPNALMTPEIRRVGDKLACRCGACNNTIGNCPMLGCGGAEPGRRKIAAMQAQGRPDAEIIDSFVQEAGIVALASPPAEGFHLLGYLMPFAGLLLGLGSIVLYIKKFRRPQPASPLPAVDRTTRDRYQARIEKELAELD